MTLVHRSYAESVDALIAERDAARAEATKHRENNVFGIHWQEMAASELAHARKVLLDDLSTKVEEMQHTAGVDFDGPWTALQEVLALIEEYQR